MRVWMLVLALAACSKHEPAAPASTGKNATAPADPNTLTFAAGTTEFGLRNFCVANYQKFMKCFEDEQFWNVLATMFFAKNPQMDDGTPGTRQKWIGMRKDDLVGLSKEHRFAADCEASIRHNQWPTEADISLVSHAQQGACPGFANAFGKMVFMDGAFYQSR